MKRVLTVFLCLMGMGLTAPDVQASASASASASGATSEAPIAAGPDRRLKGTLTTPADAPHAPVVLIIPGSGPTDRDGNNPLGIKAAPYRLLAEGLAKAGIASVRIDKRGMFASAGAQADPNDVTIGLYAGDVAQWVKATRAATGAACVWLLGHSEGGLVALVAAQSQHDICGLLLVATAGRPTGELMRDQLTANPGFGPLLQPALDTIRALEAGKRVDVSTLHPALQQLFAPQIQRFLISDFSYKPTALIAKVTVPTLILQGTSDIQVSAADARLLAGARPDAKLVLLPGVNHVLKAAPADNRSANLATYADPHLPLAPAVLDTLSGFIQAHSPH